MIKIDKKTVVVFDLDDTLYQEIDFLKSGYFHISSIIQPLTVHNVYQEMMCWYAQKQNVFQLLIEKYRLPYQIGELVQFYRQHHPNISLNTDAKTFLDLLFQKNVPIGLLTDGYSITQRHKIQALSIEPYLTDIIISEEFGTSKPSLANYLYFQDKFPNHTLIYIADNFSKDFISPNALNWITIGLLDRGFNIHQQDFSLAPAYHPQHLVPDFQFLISLFEYE